MFYDNFIALCSKKGVSPSRAAEDCGINRSNVSNWKINGYVPRGNVVQRLAEYFEVSTDLLLFGESSETKKEPAPQTESELDKELEGVDFALYGEVHDLTEGEKRDVLKFVEFLKSKRGE